MPSIKVHDKEFVSYITSAEIEKQVARVAAEINRETQVIYAKKKSLYFEELEILWKNYEIKISIS